MNTFKGDIPKVKYRDNDDNGQFWLDGESLDENNEVFMRVTDGAPDERTGKAIKYRIKNGRASLAVEDFAFITRLARKQAGPLPTKWPRYIYDGQ